jgi:hypothetical protein
VSYQQDNWLAMLPQAEFAYNNTMHASTGFSSFFVNYGFHPRFSFHIHGESVNPSAKERVKMLEQVQQDLVSKFKQT